MARARRRRGATRELVERVRAGAASLVDLAERLGCTAEEVAAGRASLERFDAGTAPLDTPDYALDLPCGGQHYLLWADGRVEPAPRSPTAIRPGERSPRAPRATLPR